MSDPNAYTDAQWTAAAVLDRGDHISVAKDRFALPVRTPDGALSADLLQKAAVDLDGVDTTPLVKSFVAGQLGAHFAAVGLPVRVEKAKLSTADRKSLPASDFVFPDKAPGSGSYPLPDEAHARIALTDSAGTPEEGAVRAAVKRKFPGIDVSKSDLELVVPMWKDDAKQIVYGVVLTPGVRDSQGDVVSAGEIEKAAHAWLVNYRKHDVQHGETPAAIVPVESFIAPSDMSIGGQPVLKGSWVLAAHVQDAEAWQRVCKGELTGWSIGGSGVRLPDAA